MTPYFPRIAFFVIAAVIPGLAFGGDRPNILFIFSDDHATQAIGAYNGWLKELDPTPSLDRLAAQGMVIENCFCTNSICGPSRAVIMTGKHSHKNGFMRNGDAFDWEQQIFPKLLQRAGYQTALFGKSHLKGMPQGFDKWAVFPGQGEYYNPRFETAEGISRLSGHCTDVVTDMAETFLRDGRAPDRPFLLMVQHKAPHRNWMPALRHLDLYADAKVPEPATLFDAWEDNASPARHQRMEIGSHMHINFDLMVDLTPEFDGYSIQGKCDRSAWNNMRSMTDQQLEAWRDAFEPRDKAFHLVNPQGKDLIRWKYQRYVKNYLRCIRGVDESVGRLMATLDDLGISDNTVVIYSSDQGFFVGDHGWFDKRWMYEESLKMPFIIKWPGVVEPGSRDTHLVQNLDYAETFLDMAGVGIPSDMQGLSMVPLLRGDNTPAWRNSIYYHYYEYPSGHMVPRHFGLRTDRYKLINFHQTKEWEFYDLKEDPDEIQNRYDDPRYAKTIQSLDRQLIDLRRQYQVNSDLPTRN